MKVLVIGAGRMGVRHVQGALSLNAVTEVCLIDIKKKSLDLALDMIGSDSRVKYGLFDDFDYDQKFDVCILATTAGNRNNLLEIANKCEVKNLLIEKPLGQSLEEVKALISDVSDKIYTSYVNLNMRMYGSFQKLKEDLEKFPQMKGQKTVTLNTGTLGIGCNGIHYLDLLYFILDADRAVLNYASIDEELIPSGRGEDFCDFGGTANIDYFRHNLKVGTALVSMSSRSTVFGGWDIVGPHGRITIDEIDGARIDKLRKPDSEMPISRYAADYMPSDKSQIESPFLGDLTAKWLEGILEGKAYLPELKESLKTHELMFEWLSHCKVYSDRYPIT